MKANISPLIGACLVLSGFHSTLAAAEDPGYFPQQWRSASGESAVVATALSADSEAVTLTTDGGKTRRVVPLAKLDKRSRDRVRPPNITEGFDNVLFVTVVEVIDGDTLRAVDGAGEPHSVHLIGVDAPPRPERHSVTAIEALKEIALNKPSTIVFDAKVDDAVIAAHVFAGGVKGSGPVVWLNKQMLDRGMAWFAMEETVDAELQSAESAAKASRLGLWRGWNEEAVAVPVPKNTAGVVVRQVFDVRLPEFKVTAARARLVSRTDSYVTWSVAIDVVNTTGEGADCGVFARWYDRNGFELDDTLIDSVDAFPPNSSRTMTGTAILQSEIASQITEVGISIE
ncbi:MAG: thermonuclease family protein [Lacipirellulaceae bacterium]